jgi:hypothetical protein
MFEKILYPTDFSDVAVKTLEYVKRLKASGAKEVIVLHVNDERGNESVIRILGESQFNKLNKNKMEETEIKLNGVKKELND